MKKTYINPKMEVIVINAPQIMAGSPSLTSEGLTGTDPILSRELDQLEIFE